MWVGPVGGQGPMLLEDVVERRADREVVGALLRLERPELADVPPLPAGLFRRERGD